MLSQNISLPPWQSIFSLDASKLLLIAGNLAPLVGVLFFHWDLFSVVLLYWSETAIIGLYNIFKLMIVDFFPALFFVPFFIVHFGIFMAVHAVFIFALFGIASHPEFSHGAVSFAMIYALFRPLMVAFGILFVEHGISFFANFIDQKEYLGYRRTKNGLGRLMFEPYLRVIFMHVTILVGGFLIVVLRIPAVGLVILILLKTCVDLFSHHYQHSAAQTPAPMPAPTTT